MRRKSCSTSSRSTLGPNTKHLVDRKDEEWVLSLAPTANMVHAEAASFVWLPTSRERTSFPSASLFAKQTHNGHVHVQITALEYIAQYALYKVWVKPSQEQSFMYGNHITRNGLGRITENTPQYQGVAVFNMAGRAARVWGRSAEHAPVPQVRNERNGAVPRGRYWGVPPQRSTPHVVVTCKLMVS